MRLPHEVELYWLISQAQHASSSSGRKRNRDEYREEAPDDSYDDSRQQPTTSGSRPQRDLRHASARDSHIEMYSGGGWRDARSKDERARYDPVSANVMSDALPSRHNRQVPNRPSQRAVVKPHRTHTRPVLPPRVEERYGPVVSAIRQQPQAYRNENAAFEVSGK